MDIFITIVIVVIVFIILSICGICCKKKREGTVYGLAGPNVTITTQAVSASPVVIPPYPVEPRHPTPHSAAPAPGFASQNPPYPTHTPHPVPTPFYFHQPMGAAGYPPTVGAAPYPPTPGAAPYPPTAVAGPKVSIMTQAVSASPVVIPPYPVEPRHPTPHAAAPALGFASHNPPYSTHTPHPVPAPFYYHQPMGATGYPPTVGAAPYPPTAGMAPYPPVSTGAPYPPSGPPVGGSAPYPGYRVQPPSYSEAVSQPPDQQLPTKGYSNQAPYNPNY